MSNKQVILLSGMTLSGTRVLLTQQSFSVQNPCFCYGHSHEFFCGKPE